jgi:RNA polymerase sigma-70 factor (ECF subfamily)
MKMDMAAGKDEPFEAHRPALLALGYRMLGDLGRAEDLVQETWLRWQGRGVEVDAPRAYLMKVMTNLCLNELDSARARREESRGDRLPEPVDISAGPLGRLEALDQISMAFLVLLQRLTAAERAVLILHDVFDLTHAEIGPMVGRSQAACRQLLKRARTSVEEERRALPSSPEEHRRLLGAFLRAASGGRADELTEILSDDVVLIADGGPSPAGFGRIRNVPRPIVGLTKVAAFVAAATPQGAGDLIARECELNGQPAILVLRDGRPRSSILIAVGGGKIRRIFIQSDPARLGRVGPLH